MGPVVPATTSGPSPATVGDNFPTEQVVNFAVGLAYGFVKENNLPEIKTCFKTCEPEYKHITNAIGFLQSGSTKQAIAEIKTLAADMPGVISVCKGITDDEAALKKWALQFSDKASALKIIEKNALMHMKDLKQDLADAKTAWDADLFFKAGTIASDAVLKLMGPVVPSTAVSANLKMPVQAAPEFVAGLLFAFVEENNLQKIEACYTGGETDFAMVE